ETAVADVCARHENILPGVGGSLLVRSTDGSGDITVSVAPIIRPETYGVTSHRCAAIFLREVSAPTPRGFLEYLRQSFMLTPSETAIAASLADGRPLKDIA